MPWEIGLFFFILGIILIFIGIRQGKIKDIDINKLPLIKPITKIIFGSCFVFLGFFQMMPVIFKIF